MGLCLPPAALSSFLGQFRWNHAPGGRVSNVAQRCHLHLPPLSIHSDHFIEQSPVAPKIFDAFVFALNRAMFRNSPSGNREDTRMASKWTYMTGNSDDKREQEVRQEIEDFL